LPAQEIADQNARNPIFLIDLPDRILRLRALDRRAAVQRRGRPWSAVEQ